MHRWIGRLDPLTREFWRIRGRPVDLHATDRWLSAPMHDGDLIGDSWLTAAAADLGATVVERPDGGLLPDLAVLDGPGFRASDLAPQVRDFYERTACWRMEVWCQWSAVFQPGGELITRLYGRRVQQLALPMHPLDVAHGVDSRVVTLAGPGGEQRAAAWIRTLRATGETIYSGCYSARTVPLAPRPSVHVAFPLQKGNVQVFLRPDVLPGGGLLLTSGAGRFGDDGAYVVVRTGRGSERVHACRVPIHETFRVHVDGDGTLRTDHVLRLWSATALRLHYKLTPAP